MNRISTWQRRCKPTPARLGALIWVVFSATMTCATACATSPRPVAAPPGAGQPIVAESAAALGTAKVECERLLAEIRAYARCPLLSDDDRADAAAQADQASIDLAPAGSPKVGAKSQADIAIACHKAAVATHAANVRCAAPAPAAD
ncbi:MAG: hypothetical protein KBG15_06410 [Kofleriaceae bacterium]|nr:hypothetical protein [Kofleriaceae bacterium]